MTVTAAQLARHYGVTRRTLRRWRDRGCPVASHRPLRFDLEAVARWREGGESPERTGRALVDVLLREARGGMSAPEILDIPRGRAAALLAQVFDRLHPDVPAYPESMLQLRRIAGADT